jgi:hypothetical protein
MRSVDSNKVVHKYRVLEIEYALCHWGGEDTIYSYSFAHLIKNLYIKNTYTHNLALAAGYELHNHWVAGREIKDPSESKSTQVDLHVAYIKDNLSMTCIWEIRSASGLEDLSYEIL